MNKNKIIAALAVLVIASGAYLFVFSDSSSSDSSMDSSMTQTQAPEINRSKQYTSDQVAEHDSEDDCWTIIDNNVYDISSYVTQHPGGDEILRACGENGSKLFNSRETADGEVVGTGLPHSSNAHNILDQFQVGIIN